MQKTLFAGLTVLEPDESLLEDGAAFIGRDRDIIDHFLEVGAKTHRHNGLPGLTDPTGPLGSAFVVASGGSIQAGLTFALAYSLSDAENGETLIGEATVVSTPDPIDIPSQQLVGSADYGDGGSLLVDTYYYAISWVDDSGGETPVGPPIGIERDPGYANARIQIGHLASGMASVGATGWRLYRATGGGAYHYLASGANDYFSDDGSHALDCDTEPLPDDVNTTNGDGSLVVELPAPASFDGDASLINVYLSDDGSFTGDVSLESFAIGSAGHRVVYRTLTGVGEGQPPDVSTSIGGASMIDPDTELLDWHWKRPVASAGALGSGEYGDVRMALDSGQMYAMLVPPSGATWTRVGSGATDYLDVQGSGAASIANRTALIFAGSGGTGVAVTDLGGGSARVLISGGAGGGGGSLRAVTDQDGPFIFNPEVLEFRASGNGIVGVTDQGGGSARVTIFASGATGATGATGPQGATGPAGAAGSLLFRASGDVPAALQNSGSAMVFRASGALGVHAEDLGGSGAVLYAPHGRRWASATVSSLASGASADFDMSLGAGYRLLEIRTNKKARVRAFATPGDRSADLARALGTDPTGDHGVMLDFLTDSDLAWRLSPLVDGANLETTPLNAIPINVRNHDSTGDVVVAFLYTPTEVV